MGVTKIVEMSDEMAKRLGAGVISVPSSPSIGDNGTRPVPIPSLRKGEPEQRKSEGESEKPIPSLLPEDRVEQISGSD